MTLCSSIDTYICIFYSILSIRSLTHKAFKSFFIFYFDLLYYIKYKYTILKYKYTYIFLFLPQPLLMNVVAIPVLPDRPVLPILWTGKKMWTKMWRKKWILTTLPQQFKKVLMSDVQFNTCVQSYHNFLSPQACHNSRHAVSQGNPDPWRRRLWPLTHLSSLLWRPLLLLFFLPGLKDNQQKHMSAMRKYKEESEMWKKCEATRKGSHLWAGWHLVVSSSN